MRPPTGRVPAPSIAMQKGFHHAACHGWFQLGQAEMGSTDGPCSPLVRPRTAARRSVPPGSGRPAGRQRLNGGACVPVLSLSFYRERAVGNARVRPCP